MGCARIVAGLVLLGILAVSCGAPDDHETVLVMAAASLTDAFAGIESAFEQANPDVDVQLNLAGSATLREQILQGAPADVFASANESTMQQLVDAGEASDPAVFATNTLAIAVPTGNPADVQGLEDLAEPDLLIGLCATGVPCGDAARASLTEAGIVAAVDTEEGDVRALLTKIEAGELDAGIVYRTDVASSNDVEAIALPTTVNPPVRYPIAVLHGAPNPTGAERLVAFVRSDEGRALLSAAGFGTP